MSNKCKICSHKNKFQINEDIIGGMSNRKIANKYGLTSSSVYRHQKNCLGIYKKSLSPNEENLVRVSVSLSDELYNIIKNEALKRGISISKYVSDKLHVYHGLIPVSMPVESNTSDIELYQMITELEERIERLENGSR